MTKRGRKPGGVGVDKRDGGGVAFGSEAARLIDQLLREIEGSDLPVTEIPKSNRHAPGATSRLEERRVMIRKESFDQGALRRPQAEFVGGARVVHDREQVVEIGANDLGVYFLFSTPQ